MVVSLPRELGEFDAIMLSENELSNRELQEMG
jgi:hypothetical protein